MAAAEPKPERTPGEIESRSLYRKLVTIINEFGAGVEPGDDMLLTAVSSPSIRILEIAKHGEAFHFRGVDPAGRRVMLIQHYTQVSLMLLAVPPPKGEKPRRIGFLEVS
jgi:hypothetical protein